MMAPDFRQIMMRLIVGMLASLALTAGMFIDEKLNNEKFTPPPPGSPDRPIPPEDLFENSGGFPLKTDDFEAFDSHPMIKGGMPQTRGGFPMPFSSDDFPVEPHGYPMPPLPLTTNHSQGSRMLDVPDLSYCNMILNAPVPPMADQVPWFCTCSLCKGGNIGPKGDRGDRGLPGLPGSPGVRGLTGSQGHPGFTGRTGMKGQKGEEGMKGIQGYTGPMGMKGERGFKGDKGDQGIEGRPGNQGSPGPPGECPSSCNSINGPPGEVGLPGVVGPRGLPGTSGIHGPKGEKGDPGEMGMHGVQGAAGQKGDQGEQGLCNCKDGAKGADGNQGAPGLKGEKGNDGSQGLVGLSGPKGEKGELGMPGVPGPCSPAIQSGFSARLAEVYPLPDRPVPFRLVLYNIQFHYNHITGVYKAPVNGTYIFSYNLFYFNKLLKVGLFHNFSPVVKNTGWPNSGMVSQQVVLHLNTGDEVWLQVKDTNSNGLYATSESSSTFSGFLLVSDNCDEPFSRDMPEPLTGTYSWGTLEDPSDQ